MKALLFDFEALGSGDKPLAKAKSAFQRAGATVATAEVSKKIGVTAGIKFREAVFTFADSQSVGIFIKQTGDIYQVKLNGKLLPVAEQDDHQKALGEIVAALDKSRVKFQAALLKTKVPLPTGMRTTVAKREDALKQRVIELDAAIEAQKEQLAALAV